MSNFFDSNISIALLVYLYIIPIFIGYIYFNKPISFEIYHIDFTSTLVRISAIWGSCVVGLSFASALGLFLGIKIFLIAIPVLTLIGYAIGGGNGHVAGQVMNIPLWIRAIFGFSFLFGTTVIFSIFLQVNKISLTLNQIIIPLVVSVLIGILFVRISIRYRRLALRLLVISEVFVLFYLILQVA